MYGVGGTEQWAHTQWYQLEKKSAPSKIRTCDLSFANLSTQPGKKVSTAGIEPGTLSLQAEHTNPVTYSNKTI